MSPEQKPWVSVSAYGRIYGVGRTTVIKWLDAGLLETYRFDTVIRIRNVRPDEQQPTRSRVCVQFSASA